MKEVLKLRLVYGIVGIMGIFMGAGLIWDPSYIGNIWNVDPLFFITSGSFMLAAGIIFILIFCFLAITPYEEIKKSLNKLDEEENK